jgi:hypothetical protein
VRRVSEDPKVQPNPQVFACGCVFTCYEDDEAESPNHKVAQLIPCRSDCHVVRIALELADETDTPAEVKEDLS